MNNTRFGLLVIVFSSLLFFSCNDDPTSIGSNLVPDDDKVRFGEFDSITEDLRQSSSFYQTDIKLGVAEKILLGKNDYLESVALLQYNISLTDTLKSLLNQNLLKINNASISLPITYSLGSKTLPFDFTVHKIQSSWSPIGFDKDSLLSLDYDNSDISFSHTITDSNITFDINTNVIESWLKADSDTANFLPNRGIILKPTTSTQRILGFNAVKLYSDPLLPTLYLELEEPDGYIDTIIVSPYTDIHVIKGSLPNVNNHIILQGGLVSQGSLFFDFSLLPKGIIINKADLTLTLDKSYTLDGDPSSDSIWVQMYKDSTEKTLTADSLVFSLLKKKDDEKYVGDIAWMIQKWLSDSTTTNQGVKLSLLDEKESAARITFYGSRTADPTLRPKLNIVYLIKSKE